MVPATRFSFAMIAFVSMAMPVFAVPKATAEPEGGEGASVSLQGTTLSGDTPVLTDATPTLQLTTEPTETTETTTNSIVGATAVSPDRCAINVELPADGSTLTIPDPATEGEARDCVELVDAMPMVMTPEGPQPIGNGTSVSGTENELLLRLGERKAGLDQEKAGLDQQALLLDAAQSRIAERTAKLIELEASINNLIGVRDQQSQDEIAKMVSLYQNMKPADAAIVMGGLPEDVLLQIASNMPPRKMSAIMAELSPTQAQALTVMMIEKPQSRP